jgi:apolipoprotein N-acyltransferase
MSVKKTVLIVRPKQTQVHPIKIQLVQGQTTQTQTVQPNAGQTTLQEVTYK